MTEYLIQEETLEDIANALREVQDIEKYVFNENAIAENNLLAAGAVTVYYTEYVDFNSQDYPELEEGNSGDFGMVAYSFLPNNKGEIVPVLQDQYSGYDIIDHYYYEGKSNEIDGTTYDKWRKISPIVFDWEGGECYKYTNEIITINKINPKDMGNTIREVAGNNIVYEGLANFITGSFTSLIDNQATTVRKAAFVECEDLTYVELPACENVQEKAFYGCSELSEIRLDNCLVVGSYAFYDCSGLERISLNNCQIIRENAFGYCEKLKTIKLPALTYLSTHAFKYCSGISQIDLGENSPDGGESYYFAPSCFYSCNPEIMNIYYETILPITPLELFGGSNSADIETIFCLTSEELIDTYVSAPGWGTDYRYSVISNPVNEITE